MIRVGKKYLVYKLYYSDTAKPPVWWDTDGKKCVCSWGHSLPTRRLRPL